MEKLSPTSWRFLDLTRSPLEIDSADDLSNLPRPLPQLVGQGVLQVEEIAGCDADLKGYRRLFGCAVGQRVLGPGENRASSASQDRREPIRTARYRIASTKTARR